jgi:hypothetical protein
MMALLWTVLTSLWFWIIAGVTALLLGVLNAIPVPDFLVTSSLALPSGVAFFAQALELQYGLGVCVSAYAARFALRAIPSMF